ncbi:hypothetical protein [Streptomyces sp. NPDC004629]
MRQRYRQLSDRDFTASTDNDVKGGRIVSVTLPDDADLHVFTLAVG